MPPITQLDQTYQTLRPTVPITVGVPIIWRPTHPIGLPPTPTPKGGPIFYKPPVVANPTTPGANPSGKNGIPLALLTIQAVQTPVKNQSLTNCLVQINFTRNTNDVNYDHVQFWLVGYHGNSNPQLLSSGTTSPATFICDATKETVVIYGQTVSATGLSAPVPFAIHTTLKLSGIVGAPPAPTIAESLVGTPTGFQFSFNQVLLPSDDAEVINSYKIYRGTLSSFSSAIQISTMTPSPNLTGALVFTDTITAATGSNYYYWVSATNTAGFESTPTPAQSGAVAGSIGSLPPSISTPFILTTTTSSVTITTTPSCFFTRADGSQVLIGQTSTACTGLPTGNTVYFFPYWRESDQTLQFVLNTDCVLPNITGVLMASASSQYIKTTTSGSIPAFFTVEMWIKGSAAGALFDFSAPQAIGTTSASICQAQVTSAGEVEFSIYSGSTWANVTTAGASVLDTTWHLILCVYDASTTTGTVYVDGVFTSDNTNFWTNTSIGVAASTAGYWHFGAIGGIAGAPITSNLYNSFSMSLIALFDVPFTAIQAAGHLAAYDNWGETLYLQELTYDLVVNLWKLNETSGTTAADSVGSNTGTYVASPTLNQTSPSVTVLGTPLIAFPYNSLLALQQQSLRNRTPLSNGGISASTAGSGTSSGGGSGGGYSGGGGRGGGGTPEKTVL